MTVSRPNVDRVKCEILGVALLALAVLVTVCLFAPSVGVVSKLVDTVLKSIAGEGRFLFPLLLAFWGLRFMGVRGRIHISHKISGGVLLFVVLLSLLHMTVPSGDVLRAGWKGEGGGLVGGMVRYVLQSSFGMPGTYIILTTFTLVGLLLSTNKSLGSLARGSVQKVKIIVTRTREWLGNFLFIMEDENNDEGVSKGAIIIDHNQPEAASPKYYVSEQQKKGAVIFRSRETGGPLPGYEQPGPGDNDNNVAYDKGETCGKILPECGGETIYQLPPLSLLSKPARSRGVKANRDINGNIRILEETLVSFGVKAKVTQVSRGPAITRYEIQPPAGVKVSRIVGLADDIALSMAAPDVRIEAPIPGKAAVGIEVPNKEIYMVHLRELLEASDFQSQSSRLTVALGKDIAGSPVLADLTRMPHLLIAGATGSGKSVCLNTIIASILFKATPEHVKFLIIDPKMVELATYNGIPHLVSPVVTVPKKAATSLRWAVKEMEYRYGLFASAGVRDIARYNDLCRARGSGPGKRPLPLLVIIIDELADLMMVAPADVEDAVCRLAQMARAAGIHLVIATQRPSVDVITGLIKANIPSRISFAVSSQIDSRTILDMGGAEKLLGKGDMLFFPVGAPKPLRVQGAYMSDREVENTVEYWKKQAEPVYEDRFLNDDAKGEEGEPDVEDELLNKATELFITVGHASISLLQRRFHVGYARAARIIDIMEKKGIIGGYEGSKPRSVLMTMEQYDNINSKGDKNNAGN